MKKTAIAVAVISTVAVFGLLAQVFPSAATTVQDGKREKVRKLVRYVVTEEAMTNQMVQSIAMFKELFPAEPSSYWLEFQRVFSYSNWVELYVPIYSKRFSNDEVNKLLAFYESPIGRKFTKAAPEIAIEASDVSLTWARQVGERVQNDVTYKSNSLQSHYSANAKKQVGKISTEAKRILLSERGLSLEDGYDLLDNGMIVWTAQVAPNINSNALPRNVNYFIQSKDSGAIYFSEKEPKPFGSGYKFTAWPQQAEIIVSGSVTITKLNQ